MMNQAPRGFLSWLRLGAALPLIAGLLFAFGATARPSTPDMQGSDQVQQKKEDPKTISVVVNAYAPGMVLVDGTTVEVENLATYLNGLNLETSLVTISLQADPDTKLEVVDKVKEQLRKALTLRLSYKLPGAEEGVRRYMPPMPGTQSPSGLKVQTTEEAMKSVKRENIISVRANSANKILLGNKRYENAKAIIPDLKAFIREHGSNTVVSFQADFGTSYECYYSLQQAIRQAYDELRDEMARNRYGKPLTELNDEEYQTVVSGLLMCVSEAEMKRGK